VNAFHTAGEGSRDAEAVVIAAGPGDARRLLTGAPGEVLERWDEQSIPVRAAVLDIGLSRIPLPQVNYSIGVDRPLYFSVHTKVAKLAPDGGAVIHAAMYLDPTTNHDPEAILSELEDLTDRVQPGWRDLVVHRRFLPQMAVTNAVVDAARGGLAGRPGPEVPGAPGLYVAGDWVGPTGMLAYAALSSGLSAGSLAATVRAAAPELATPV
jgi:phytoene dehydrogenase-like protein